MSIFQASLLGIVEGLTEFLPISSTFHLIFASKFLHLPQTQFLTFFEVFIQSGAILAVVLVYFKYLLSHQKELKMVLVSFIPTAIVGFVLHTIIKTVFFESTFLMLSVFFLMGIVFFIVEYLIRKNKLTIHKTIHELSFKDAVIIGLCQSLAVVPGVSRAGAVLAGMMILGYKRDQSAMYSFLLAIPTIFAASAFDLIKTDPTIFQHASYTLPLLVGFTTSFISALFVIKWFIKFLQKNSLISFGIYRILLAIALFFLR